MGGMGLDGEEAGRHLLYSCNFFCVCLLHFHFSGRPFIPYLDELPPVVREDTGPFRMPISDKYKVQTSSNLVNLRHKTRPTIMHVLCTMCLCLQDMGTVVMGKVESGGVMKGASLLLMPNRVSPIYYYIGAKCNILVLYMYTQILKVHLILILIVPGDG